MSIAAAILDPVRRVAAPMMSSKVEPTAFSIDSSVSVETVGRRPAREAPAPPKIWSEPPDAAVEHVVDVVAVDISSKAEPIAFSIEDRVSVLKPSAVTSPVRLISTLLAEVAYDTVSAANAADDLVRALDAAVENVVGVRCRRCRR